MRRSMSSGLRKRRRAKDGNSAPHDERIRPAWNGDAPFLVQQHHESHFFGHRRRFKLHEDSQSSQIPICRRSKAPQAVHTSCSAHRSQGRLIVYVALRPCRPLQCQTLGHPFIDVTPDMPKRPRRDEVLAWLKTHPKVKRFVVIDDEDDELDQLPLFQPLASTGLTEKLAKGVANYLAGKTDEDMRCNAVVRVLQNIKSVFKGHEG
jgi:HAD domain in Swiss Army Knife RNA repair proteins